MVHGSGKNKAGITCGRSQELWTVERRVLANVSLKFYDDLCSKRQDLRLSRDRIPEQGKKRQE